VTDAQAPASLSVVPPDQAASRVPELGMLLHACVHDGASVGFVLPFAREESEAFWSDQVLPAVRSGSRLLLVAECDGSLTGTVQLCTHTPPNQPHRAEVSKLLVHPNRRRRGIARALMTELERQAVRLGRGLLTLDTRSGDSAEPLYASLGYRTAGVIPGYCLNPFEDRLDSTTVMYKVL
jgi:ribosomal protein S18 acetylase RimI-like enzyme